MKLMGDQNFVPAGVKGVKFTMLRQQHYEKAQSTFGTDDFDRVFVVHALSRDVRQDLAAALTARRVHWLTARELVADLMSWYASYPSKAALRHSLVGDLVHLLNGFCGLQPPATAGWQTPSIDAKE